MARLRRLWRWCFPPVKRSTDPRNRMPFDPNVQYKSRKWDAMPERETPLGTPRVEVERVAREMCRKQPVGVTVGELAHKTGRSEAGVAMAMRQAVKGKRFIRVSGKNDGITRWRPVP